MISVISILAAAQDRSISYFPSREEKTLDRNGSKDNGPDVRP